MYVVIHIHTIDISILLQSLEPDPIMKLSKVIGFGGHTTSQVQCTVYICMYILYGRKVSRDPIFAVNWHIILYVFNFSYCLVVMTRV